MDYFVSKLSLIYFSTFSGNRFNSDYIAFAILELVVAGCFRKQLSQEMPFGTLEEMPHRFSCFNPGPHTRASLLHSHFDPRGSAPSVKPKQTARPLDNAQLFSPSSPCERMAAAQEEVMCWSTGCQPAGDSPPVPNSTSLAHSGTGCPMSLPSCLLILPSPYKITRWLDTAPREGKHRRMGDWYQLFQRKSSCRTPNSEKGNLFHGLSRG